MARDYRAEYARRKVLAREKGWATYSGERASKEIRTATEQNDFRSRAEWQEYRREHKEALRDLRAGDTSKAWASYEGSRSPNNNVRRASEFAEMRSRIDKIKGSRAKHWGEGEERQARKQATVNAIMHDYVREWHDDLNSYEQERLVWDNEGDTP